MGKNPREMLSLLKIARAGKASARGGIACPASLLVTCLRARADETPYIKSRVNIWNNCIKLIARSETLTTIKISKFEKDLKKTLLKIQNAFNSVEWYPDRNFTLR